MIISVLISYYSKFFLEFNAILFEYSTFLLDYNAILLEHINILLKYCTFLECSAVLIYINGHNENNLSQY